MSSNALFFSWKRSIPGREQVSAEHFQDFGQYLGGLQQQGTIQSFDTVFLNPHGGSLGGFFLIRGDSPKLDALLSTEAWAVHQIRAVLHLDEVCIVRGVTGEGVMERMALWTKSLPEPLPA
jgi:hypothetical protein